MLGNRAGRNTPGVAFVGRSAPPCDPLTAGDGMASGWSELNTTCLTPLLSSFPAHRLNEPGDGAKGKPPVSPLTILAPTH